MTDKHTFKMEDVREVGLTQAEFAEIVGVSRPTACLWINGHKQPGRSNQERIDRLAPLITRLKDRGGVKHLLGEQRRVLVYRLKEITQRDPEATAA